MKIILIPICIVIAWLLFWFVTLTHAQQINPVAYVVDTDRVILIKGKVAGDLKTWLVVEGHNGYQWQSNGYDPCLTRVVCDYKPMMRKMQNGQWEIMFVSPIAENLP